MKETGVGFIIAAALLILTVLVPTALYFLWTVTGFANSIGAPTFDWWQFVVGTYLVFVIKAFATTGVNNGN